MNEVLQYIQHHWFQLTVDGVTTLNILAAGTRIMGWTQLSDFCGKLEQAISAMVQTALNRGQSSTATPTSATEKPKTGV